MQGFLGKACRAGIDRLDQRHVGKASLIHDMIGMNHVGPAVEPFDLAGNIAGFADRQRLVEIVRMGTEKDQRQFTGLIMDKNPVRNAAVAAGRWLVAVHMDFQGDDHTFRRVGDARLSAPVDDSERDVKQQIANLRRFSLLIAAKQLRHGLFELRANAFQA